METVTYYIFWTLKSLQTVTALKKLRCMLLGRKAMTNLESILKSRDIISLTKVHLVKATVFPVIMYGCETWTWNKAEHQRTDAFKLCWRRLFESPLDCKEIKTANPKRNQPWAFTGRTDAEAEAQALVLWSSDVKSRLTAKDPAAGKDWRQGKGGVAGDECTYIQWSITQP